MVWGALQRAVALDQFLLDFSWRNTLFFENELKTSEESRISKIPEILLRPEFFQQNKNKRCFLSHFRVFVQKLGRQKNLMD